MNRDQILEQALKHELRSDNAMTPHVDAETLAAWQDDALNAAQSEAVELHVSTCARCQAMLAAFARGTVTAATQPAVVVERFQWWKWWLAPIAAGAAAVTLWMVVPEEQQIATRPPQPQATIALDKPQAPAPFEQKQDSANAAPADALSAEPEKRARAAEADADFKENKLRVDIARDNRQQQLKDQAVPAPKEEAAVAQAAPPVPAAPAAPAATAAAPPTGYSPVVPAAPARTEAAGARVAELQKNARLAARDAQVFTQGGTRGWRVIDGRIERSDDGGETWMVLRALAGESITGGDVADDGSCWFIGRSGVVLRSVDGTTFTRVDLPFRVDLAIVVATNAREAMVQTADRQSFRTLDGGRTWTRL